MTAKNLHTINYITTFLDDVLGLQDIKRYHMCGLNREQSVTEHSFNTAMIAWETGVWLRTTAGPEWSFISPYRILAKALLHDVEEAFVGDIAYPVKTSTPEFKEAYDQLVQWDRNVWMASLPSYMVDELKSLDPLPHLKSEKKDVVDQVVKMSDHLELTLFTLSEYLRGNRMVNTLVLKGLSLCQNMKRHHILRREDCPLERVLTRVSRIIRQEVHR